MSTVLEKQLRNRQSRQEVVNSTVTMVTLLAICPTPFLAAIIQCILRDSFFPYIYRNILRCHNLLFLVTFTSRNLEMRASFHN